MQMSGSSGSYATWKPISLYIASIAVFSLSKFPLDNLETFGAGVFDDQLHEQVTETPSLQVGTDANA